MVESELLCGLNESQRAAVLHIDGPLLVLAGPGSGKTRVITHRVAHMIQTGIQPSSILALTFTNKAAGEMRHRLERLVGTNQVWMGTFHGFCVRLLRRYARLAGLPENFSIYDTNDAETALKAAIAEAKFELTHVSLGTLANRISYFKNRLVTPEILEAESLSSAEYQVSQVYPYYQQQLLRNGAVDFDDILMHTATLLRSNPEIRQDLDERLRYVMVDEYQDTNLAQYVIVRHLCVQHPNLAATGDPDQSIYGWRGANVKNVTNLERDYSDLKIIRLEQNYRSTPQILSIADQLIQHNEYRKSKELVPSRAEGNSVRLAIYATARDEAEDIADQIESLTADKAHRYQDFGILYRTNAHSRLVEQALLRRQIPYQLIGGFRFYLRKEIKDLVAYLLLIHNPDDNVALQRAINTPPRGIGKQTVGKLEAHANAGRISMLEACRECVQGGQISKRAANAVRSFLKIFDQLASIVHGPLVDLLQTTIELTRYREHLLKQGAASDGTSEVTANLDELLAEAHELDQESDEERPALEAFLEFAALQADTDRLDTSQDAVTLMTLHAAKGLEFPWVYVIAVEENILPHARSKDDPMSLEEERRLLFVGITRAQDRLQISYAKSRGFSGQGSGVPSSFLTELPRSEMQIVDQTENLSSYFGSELTDRRHAQHDTWDEYSQVESTGDFDSQGQDDFGEECQLPPDEIQARLLQRVRHGGKLGNRLMLGSQLTSNRRDSPGEVSVDKDPHGENLANEDADQQSTGFGDEFRCGTLVNHSKFGSGEVVAAEGQGAKRAVSIHFFSDGSRRTFRLSHVDLKIEMQP